MKMSSFRMHLNISCYKFKRDCYKDKIYGILGKKPQRNSGMEMGWWGEGNGLRWSIGTTFQLKGTPELGV